MIVRILEDGQYEVDDAIEANLQHLDEELTSALSAKDEARFRTALDALVLEIHRSGRAVDSETMVPSDLVVPALDSSLDEVRAILDSE